MSEAQLLRLVGATNKADITQEQARCIRSLVMHEDIRDVVLRAKRVFPDTVFAGVRSLP